MKNRLIPLDPSAPFRFSCSPEAVCFNECCRDLNQALTPYDVLRLKRKLGISSQRFLQQYTRRHAGPGSGLPVVTLIPGDPQQFTCPFVSPEGCRVYPDRPSSCRMYPVVRILRRSRDSAQVLEEYRLLREPHCRGFDATRRQTVHEWMFNQGLREYNAENDRLLEVIRLKARFNSKSLPPSLSDQVYTALYDLDRFRQRLCGESLAHISELDPDGREAALKDESALLRLGLEWVKQLLKKTFAC
jgi:Fe-S-cluster containining protein